MLAAPNTIGVTFDLLEGEVPIQDAAYGPVNEGRRAAEVLRRVRLVPEGFVTTYGDLVARGAAFRRLRAGVLPRPGRALGAR